MSKSTLRQLLTLATMVIGLIVYWQQAKTEPTTASEPARTGAVEAPSVAPTSTPSTVPSTGIQTNSLIVRHVDGDTVVARIDGEKDDVKIRLLGVNTPESVDPRRPVECFGKEASAFAGRLLDGKRVKLVADKEADDVDKYGRLLRNIILEDGTDVNAKLVQDGYAYAYLSFPLNKARKVQLKQLQTEAEAAKRGLWDPKTCNGLK